MALDLTRPTQRTTEPGRYAPPMSSKPSAAMSRLDMGVARRSEIVSTFARMVAERGYDNVSIRDVAEAVGISKGTVVHHFMSKDRLLERVHGEYMDRRLAELRSLLAATHDPAVQLACIIQQLAWSLQSDRDSTIAFAREIMRFASDDIMVEIRLKRHEYYSLLRDVLQRGMKDGSFRTDNDAIVALQIFGMTNWSWTWFRPEGAWSADEIAETFIRTILAGVGTVDASELDAHWFANVRRTAAAAVESSS